MNVVPSAAFRRVACAVIVSALPIVVILSLQAQAPDPMQAPAYKPEYAVAGGLRIVGSELKGNTDLLVAASRSFIQTPSSRPTS